MATIIDFIEEMRAKQKANASTLTIPDVTGGRLKPVTDPGSQVVAGVDQLTPRQMVPQEPLTSHSTQMAATSPTLAPYREAAQYTPTDRLMAQRAYTRQLSDPSDPNYTEPKNNDRGFWGRLLDVGRQAVISAGQAYNTGQGSPSERLMGALGAGIAGGAYGGFHPQVDEERQRLYDIERSRGLESEIEGQIDRDQLRALKQEQIDAIPANQELRRLQIEGTRENNALRELGRQKYFDPNNTFHVELAKRANLDPSSLTAFDARDPKSIKLGNDVLTYDRTDGKWKIAGTRGDLVDWKLADGRVVSIPADKAAYNDTIERMGAYRVNATVEIAKARIAMDEKQFGLAVAKFETAKKQHDDAVARGDLEAARKFALSLQDALTEVNSNVNLTRGQQDILNNLIGNIATIPTAPQE